MRKSFSPKPQGTIAAVVMTVVVVLLNSSMYPDAALSTVSAPSGNTPIALPSATKELQESPAESPVVLYPLQTVVPETEVETEVYYDEVTDPEFHGYTYMWKTLDEIPLSAELQQCVFDACELYGVDMPMVLSVIERESTFRPDVISDNCWGLMQIHSINFSWLLNEEGIDATTHEGNIMAGTLMISQLLEKYENVHLALMAYNCGESGARKLWEQGIYSSKYSRAVVTGSEEWAAVLEDAQERSE